MVDEVVCEQSANRDKGRLLLNKRRFVAFWQREEGYSKKEAEQKCEDDYNNPDIHREAGNGLIAKSTGAKGSRGRQVVSSQPGLALVGSHGWCPGEARREPTGWPQRAPRA